MPKIAFFGFPPGKVRVNVTQQDATAEAVIDLSEEDLNPAPEPAPTPEPAPEKPAPTPAPGPSLPDAPKGASVQITATRLVGTAPAGFFFSATGSGFGVQDHYYDVRYRWTFDDPGHYTRHDTNDIPWDRVYDVDGARYIVRGPKVFLSDGETEHVTRAVLEPGVGYRPDFGTTRTYLGPDRNIAYGPHVSHVFEKPGTYTVRCEVRKRDTAPVVKTMTIKVQDPDAVFSGSDTICWAPNGNFAGAPAGAQQVTTESAAISALTGGDNRRLLIRRGTTYTLPSIITRSGGWQNVQIGAFGSGAPPKRTGTFVRMQNPNPNGTTTWWGIDVIGSYDPTDPWKTSRVSGGYELYGDCAMTTFWDMEVSGVYQPFQTPGNGPRWGMVFGNLRLTRWEHYGMFFHDGAGYVGMAGCFLRQDPDTVLGHPENTSPWYAQYGPIRFAAVGSPCAFNLVDLNVVGGGEIGGFPGVFYQPNFRLGRRPSSYGPTIEEASMDRMRMQNTDGLGSGQTSTTTGYPRKFMFDKIYCLRAWQDAVWTSISISGLHWRNLIMVLDNTRINGRWDHWWYRSKDVKATDHASMAQHGIDFYNSMIVDTRSGGNTAWYNPELLKGNGANLKPFGWVKIGNNIVHMPNRSDGKDSGDGPFDSTPLWSTTTRGARRESKTLETNFKLVDPGLYAPRSAPPLASTSHSNPGNGQGSRIAVDDFFGNVRTTAHRGPYELW